MGVLDNLACCMGKSSKYAKHKSNRTESQCRGSKNKSTEKESKIYCQDTEKVASCKQSQLTEKKSEFAGSVHDIEVCLEENTKSPTIAQAEMSDLSRTSSGASTNERMNRNVNIVRPRISTSPTEHRISLPEDIEQHYDPDQYNQMMSRMHTSMSRAYNKESSGLEQEDTSHFAAFRPTSSSGQTNMGSRDSDSGTKVYCLIQASCRGDLTTLQRLFQEGTDMAAADYDGRRALHLSAAEGHFDCVKFLLEKCNVPHSPRDRWYHTPLDEAKTFKRDAVVKYLTDLIAKEEEKERGAKTYLLLNSACTGDVRTLKRLYQEGVDMKLADYDGRTCLHLASAEGHLDCVRFLLEQCEVPHSPKDRWFNTPLMEARNAKHAKCIEFLEDYVHQYEARREGASVYSILNSASRGDTRALERLAKEGEDMMATDYDGRTALHLAAAEGHIDVVSFLMEKCKVDHSPKDRWQHTPLDEAKNAKNDTIVKYLVGYISNKPKIIADSKTK